MPLANLTLGATASVVTFSSISGSYRDLVLVFNGIAATSTASPRITIRFNADSGTNYSNVNMTGDGTTASSASGATDTFILTGLNNLSTTERNTTIWNIMDYSTTDKHKTVLSRANLAGVGVAGAAGRWANTAAITSITVQHSGSGQLGATSTFALYGVSA